MRKGKRYLSLLLALVLCLSLLTSAALASGGEPEPAEEAAETLAEEAAEPAEAPEAAEEAEKPSEAAEEAEASEAEAAEDYAEAAGTELPALDGETVTAEVGDYQYTITDGAAVLSKYLGTDASVTIPTSMTYEGTTYKITKIGASAFADNAALESVDIPAAISVLDGCAFKNCTSLRSVTIHGNIEPCSGYSIDTDNYYSDRRYPSNSVFYDAGVNADGLTVTFADGVTRVPDYLFATGSSKSDGVYAHVTKVVMADSVTDIGAYAFYNCHDLTDISFGGVQTIGANAFAYNTALKTLTLGSSVTSVGDSAFRGNTALQSVTFDAAVTSLGANAFCGDASLKTLELPKRLASIGSSCFADCTSVTSIDFAQSNVTLGICAFKSNTSLTSVTFHGDVADCSGYSIDTDNYYTERRYPSNSVFYNAGLNADGLTVTFADGVTRVPDYLFATGSSKADGLYAHITKVVMADSVTDIGAYAFYNCHDLTDIDFGGVQTIGANAFAYNTALKALTLGSAVASAGDSAFRGDTALQSVAFDAALTSLGANAFCGDASLKTLTFPKRLASIGSSCFADCTALSSIDFGQDNVTLGICAFKSCTSLTEITIRGNIADCSGYSVDADNYYTDRRYPSNSVFYNAGANSESLTVTFTEGVTAVPAYLFATGATLAAGDFAHVTKVVLPSSVESVGLAAFCNCHDLADAYYPGTKAAWGDVSVGERNEPLTDHLRFGGAVTPPDPMDDPDRLPGDVDGNGSVGMEDVVLLRRWLAGADVAIRKANANVNGDGEVDILDLIRLRRFLASADGVVLQ